MYAACLGVGMVACLSVAGIRTLAAPQDRPITEESILRESSAPEEHVSAQVSANELAVAEVGLRMSYVADEVRKISDPQGFAGLVTDPEHSAMTVHWHGEPSPELLNLAQSTPYGITIEVVTEARFTRVEVMNASSALIGDRALVAELGIVTTSVRPDGSGLAVQVSGRAPDSATRAQLESRFGLPGGLFFEPDSPALVLQQG